CKRPPARLQQPQPTSLPSVPPTLDPGSRAVAGTMHHGLPPGNIWRPGRGTPAQQVTASGYLDRMENGGPMHLLLRAAVTAAILLPLAVAPVSAQNCRGAFGIYGGGVWFSDLNDNGDFRIDNFF